MARGCPALINNRSLARGSSTRASSKPMPARDIEVASTLALCLLFRATMSTDHAARTLTHLAQALGETLDLSVVLDRVAHAAVDFVPGSLARIWTVDGAALSLSAEAGAVNMAPGEDRTLALGQQWAGRVASTLQPRIVVDDDGVSAATVPLVAHGQLVGVLLLATQRTHRFAADELDLLGCVAIHAGIAIHTATLFARADRR